MEWITKGERGEKKERRSNDWTYPGWIDFRETLDDIEDSLDDLFLAEMIVMR